MNYIVCGLPFSGKSTVVTLLREIGNIDVTDLLEVGVSVDALLASASEKTQILIISSPVIECFRRSSRKSFLEFLDKYDIERKEKIIKYMTELPGCTIIKNDLSLDHLRLQVKKYLKK